MRLDGAQYSPFSRLRGKVRIRWFPRMKVAFQPPRKLQIPVELRSRERRTYAGRQLSDLMTGMMFESSDYRRTLFHSLLDAMEIHGPGHRVLEDVERSPASYRRTLLGSFALGRAMAAETVPGEHVGLLLPNAVALNSTSFNAARMVGPAIAGVLIAAVGSGWVFLINAASFVAVLCSLSLLRASELRPRSRAPRTRGSLVDGFRYVWQRPDLKAILLMLFFIGTFGLNFPIFISTMSVSVFHKGAGQYGLLSSIMAVLYPDTNVPKRVRQSLHPLHHRNCRPHQHRRF